MSTPTTAGLSPFRPRTASGAATSDAEPDAEPRRIQRKRSAGWRMPEGAVYVGRGTYLGNPFRIYEHCKGGDWGVEDTGRFHRPLGHGWTRAGAAKAAVECYQQAFEEQFPTGSTARYMLVMDLAGKDLVCWCPEGQPCHADFLLTVANPAPAA